LSISSSLFCFICFSLLAASTPEIYTLSLHDALPIFRPDIVRVRTVEGGRLDPHPPGEGAEGHHSECRVGEVLGVMAQRRGRIVHGRGTMQIGDRAKGWFSHRGCVQGRADPRPDGVLEADGKLR